MIFFLVNSLNIVKRRVKLVEAPKLVLSITNVIVKLIFLWVVWCVSLKFIKFI